MHWEFRREFEFSFFLSFHMLNLYQLMNFLKTLYFPGFTEQKEAGCASDLSQVFPSIWRAEQRDMKKIK